jgi:hypothetical protein
VPSGSLMSTILGIPEETCSARGLIRLTHCDVVVDAVFKS